MSDYEVYDKTEDICFMPVSIKEEIKRGILHECTYKESCPTSHRVYTADEERKLPLAGRDYLRQLEKNGHISSLQREWIIDSILENAEIVQLERVPMKAIVAIIFLVLSLESMKDRDLSGSTVSMKEASLRLH